LQIAVGVVMLLTGLVLRFVIADYAGPADQPSFNGHLFSHFGSYSDIASLYFRDQLWNHPTPYLDYALEYPVGTGALIWITGFFNSTVWSFFLMNAIVLIVAGYIVVYLVTQFAGERAWLLVLSPALAFHVVLNWDMAAIALTVGALLMFHRERDIPGAILLTLAVWTKFFPIMLVPLVVAYRWKKPTFWPICAIFAGGSVLMNLFFAVEFSGGVGLRDNWTHFFIYNRDRPREVNLWNLFDRFELTTSQVNLISGALTLLGVVLIAVLVYRNRDRPALEVLSVASIAAISWLFFLSKVYSPQYGLWVVALIPLAAVPVGLGAYFVAVDAFYFAASFAAIMVSNELFSDQVLMPSMVVREGVLLALVVWAVIELHRRTRETALPTPVAGPTAA
jgi:hypothetical protein